MCLITLIYCPWAYGSSLKYLHPHLLGQILKFWVTSCGVNMMSLHHGWGWQPPQTPSCINIRCIQSVWSHWYAVHGHMAVVSNSYTPKFGSYFGVWVTCAIKMMSLRHGWGWQPPQTASCINNRHIQCVWSQWYAVHGHMSVASNSYTHTTWVRFRGSGSLVKSKWCHYVMVELYSHLKLLSASTLDVYKVFEHIDMLLMGIR